MKDVKVRVLQIKNTPETRNYKFSSFDFLNDCGLKVSKEMYNEVYETEMQVDLDNIIEELDKMYVRFQSPRMQDYRGHSLSVSDIVEIDGVCYYVDSYGFEKMDF